MSHLTLTISLQTPAEGDPSKLPWGFWTHRFQMYHYSKWPSLAVIHSSGHWWFCFLALKDDSLIEEKTESWLRIARCVRKGSTEFTGGIWTPETSVEAKFISLKNSPWCFRPGILPVPDLSTLISLHVPPPALLLSWYLSSEFMPTAELRGEGVQRWRTLTMTGY